MKRFIENVFASKELYYNLLSTVCEKYDLSHTEVIILLCLTNYPDLNTATEIVELNKLTKSAVSASVRILQERGYVTGEYLNGNRRSVHLRVCEAAKPIIEDARKEQEHFFDILLNGFTDAEKLQFKECFERITENINEFNKDFPK